MSEVVIIGGGWAGISTAIYLERPAVIFEASPNLGGRARTIKYKNYMLDNGQHIMINAYHTLKDILKKLNVDITETFLQKPMSLELFEENNKLNFSLPNLPSPFHFIIGILKAEGISLKEKYSILKLAIFLKFNNFNLKKDKTLFSFLKEHNQSDALIKKFWEPIALATLSTPIKIASAQIFINVLHDSFYVKASNSDLLLPKKNLSDIIPNPVINFFKNKKIDVKCNARATEIIIKNNKCTGVIVDNQKISAKKVVIATPIDVAYNLLNKENLTTFEPITTIYLIFSEELNVKPMQGFIKKKSQWMFNLYNKKIISIIITGKIEKKGLLELILDELKDFIDTKKLIDHKIITEKKAAFSCTPENNSNRPSNYTDIQNLYLAGNYTNTRYPATLEGALLSGKMCAEIINLGSLKF